MKSSLVLAAALLLSVACFGQAFPAPPSPAQSADSDQITSQFASDAVQPKTADHSFWKLNGMSAALTAGDLAQTAQCLLAKICVEHNPLFGANPGMARLFGTSVPMLAAQIGVSYYMKKSGRTWKAVPVVGSISHAAGIASGLGIR